MNDGKSDLMYQFWGWLLFIVCAFIFIGSSIRTGDVLMLIGSLFFLVACFFFLVPLIKAFKR
ncbi:MAG: cytochrome oxidase subunit III [Deltaproteobacteria bacterium]|jgi:hypothetical protein|nr:cytochrome oxidase subunit III [Deltaproteobacteria bacterium]